MLSYALEAAACALLLLAEQRLGKAGASIFFKLQARDALCEFCDGSKNFVIQSATKRVSRPFTCCNATLMSGTRITNANGAL